MLSQKIFYLFSELKSYSISWLVRKAVSNPKKVFDYFFRTGNSRWIYHIFQNLSEYQGFILELDNSRYVDILLSELKEAFTNLSGRTVRGNSFVPGQMKTNQARQIYALVRKVRPNRRM